MLHLEQWRAKGETFIERNAEHYADLPCNFDLLSFKAVQALKNSAAIHGAIMEERKVQPESSSQHLADKEMMLGAALMRA